MKVGRVAIITRGRYAGKKVRQIAHIPPELRTQFEDRDGLHHWNIESTTEKLLLFQMHFFLTTRKNQFDGGPEFKIVNM